MWASKNDSTRGFSISRALWRPSNVEIGTWVVEMDVPVIIKLLDYLPCPSHALSRAGTVTGDCSVVAPPLHNDLKPHILTACSLHVIYLRVI